MGSSLLATPTRVRRRDDATGCPTKPRQLPEDGRTNRNPTRQPTTQERLDELTEDARLKLLLVLGNPGCAGELGECGLVGGRANLGGGKRRLDLSSERTLDHVLLEEVPILQGACTESFIPGRESRPLALNRHESTLKLWLGGGDDIGPGSPFKLALERRECGVRCP